MAQSQDRGYLHPQSQATPSTSRAAGQPVPPLRQAAIPVYHTHTQAQQPTGNQLPGNQYPTYNNDSSQSSRSGYVSYQTSPGAGQGRTQPHQSRTLYTAPQNSQFSRQQQLYIDPSSVPRGVHVNFPSAAGPFRAPAMFGPTPQHQAPQDASIMENDSNPDVDADSSEPFERCKSDPPDFRWRLYRALNLTNSINWERMITDEPDSELWCFVYTLTHQQEVLKHISSTGRAIELASFIRQLKNYGFERNKNKREGIVSWWHPSGNFFPGNDDNYTTLNKVPPTAHNVRQDQPPVRSQAPVASTPSGNSPLRDYILFMKQLEERMGHLEQLLREEKENRRQEVEFYETRLAEMAGVIAVLEDRVDDLTKANTSLENVLAKQGRYKAVNAAKASQRSIIKGLFTGSAAFLEGSIDLNPGVDQSRPATSSSTSSGYSQTMSMMPPPRMPDAISAPPATQQGGLLSPPAPPHAHAYGLVNPWTADHYYNAAKPGQLTSPDTSPAFPNGGLRGLPTHSAAGQPVAEVGANQAAPNGPHHSSIGGLDSEHGASWSTRSGNWGDWLMRRSGGTSSAQHISSRTQTTSHPQRSRDPVTRADQPRPMSGIEPTSFSSGLGPFSSSGQQ